MGNPTTGGGMEHSSYTTVFGSLASYDAALVASAAPVDACGEPGSQSTIMVGRWAAVLMREP